MKQWRSLRVVLGAGVGVLWLSVGDAAGQDWLKSLPRYDPSARLTWSATEASMKLGTVLPMTWVDSGRALEFTRDGSRWRFDAASRKITALPPATVTAPAAEDDEGSEGGSQFEAVLSPDSQFKATHRNHNVWISRADGTSEVAVSSDGSALDRIRYGKVPWVYGEELDQYTAMWWNRSSTKLAFYRFDEKLVSDYRLQLNQTKLYSTTDVEAYPKAGSPNPIAELIVYDVATKQSVPIDIRNGKAFTNDVIGYYTYDVAWSADGSELLVNRTNRRQNVMEFTACSASTGQCRVIVREEWLVSWTENHPEIRWLDDNQRFIWGSERTGFKNYYLYDISGKLLATLTRHPFEVANVVRVDEKTKTLWYTARSGDNHMKLQLHRVGFNGTGDRRLTDPAFNHTVTIAPDGRHFVDVADTHDTPPVTKVLDGTGKQVAVLATSDLAEFRALGLQTAEMFTFKAADGVTDLHGMLFKPSGFDPTKKYPVLVFVYAGPGTNGAEESFAKPIGLSEFGFVVLWLDSRSAGGRGKRFLDAIYGKLGVVEVDDQAAGVRSLWSRPYIDRNRVGIAGMSYGGYVAAMALLRHPGVFQAATAASPVTAWDHYDTIYTERYMGTPQENSEGYKAGSAMTYVNDLEGRLMIYYGTADNNVHPSNAMHLIKALQAAGKSFDVMVGPDQAHTMINYRRMMQFFIENLVVRTPLTP